MQSKGLNFLAHRKAFKVRGSYRKEVLNMGIFDKILGKDGEESGVLENLDDIIDSEDVDAVTPEAKMYVKKISLRNEGDVDLVIRELQEGNVVIIDTAPIIKQPNRLKKFTDKIKTVIKKSNGDIAALVPSHELILATPSAVKIVKARK